MKQPRLGSALALVCLVTVGGFTALPILAVGSSGSPGCGVAGEIVDDGTPSILGAAALTVADLRSWWAATGRGQPARLAVDIDDLLALYVSEGDAEGVRGDLALAQAIVETGYFTNSDTRINNFAGIRHYDGASAGTTFLDPIIGVRAHIQLLKKYALGNEVVLANSDVAPRAGASATTWGGLAATWASDPAYWAAISSVYDAMSADASSSAALLPPVPAPGCPMGDLAVAGDYALPVERRWYDEHPDWFTRPHHDYPAVDIPVPIGTPLYAVTNGVVVGTPTSGKCGVGVVLNGDDGAQYTYCHGHPGTPTVAIGDRVTVGQYLLDSASTGNSTGPHLHFGVEVDGAKRCPQALLVSTAEGEPLAPSVLPTTGCTS